MDTVWEYVFVGGLILMITIFALGFYFLPTLLAVSMHNHYKLPIFLLNLFTGWTGLGWIGSLIWAVII